MFKITLGNEKGGVGKTALSTHIAAGLACRGARVMLVDADPQGHATLMFGLKKEPGLYNLLVRNAEFKEVVRTVPAETYGIPGDRLPEGKLYVLPSNVETRSIAGSVSDVGLIGARFEEVRDWVDVVIFDTSPTPSLLHGAVYIATDGIIYPTKPEMWGFDGLVESWLHRDQAESYRQNVYGLPKIKAMGIVPVMVERQTVEHSTNILSLKERFGSLVWREIPKRIIWSEASKYCRPVYSLNPQHEAAADVWELIDRVEEVIRVKQVS
ncbi:MAG: ParA family protein [Anaerolineae bacterium]|nr:ParA family protein [Anaerolineae bacterium]